MDTPGCPAFPPPRRPGGPPGLPRSPSAFALGAPGPHRRPPPLSPRPGRCPPLRAQPRYLGVASPGPPAVAVHGKPPYPPGAAGTRGAAGGWGGRGRRPFPALSASLSLLSLPLARRLGFCPEPRPRPTKSGISHTRSPGILRGGQCRDMAPSGTTGASPDGSRSRQGPVLPSCVATETGVSGMVPVLQKQGGKREKRRRERPGPAAATVGTGPGWGTAAPLPGMENGRAPRSGLQSRDRPPTPVPGPHRAGAAATTAARARGSGMRGRPGCGAGSAAGALGLPGARSGAITLSFPGTGSGVIMLSFPGTITLPFPGTGSRLPHSRVSPVPMSGVPEHPVSLGQAVPGLRTLLQARTGPGSFPGLSRRSFALSQPGPSEVPTIVFILFPTFAFILFPTFASVLFPQFCFDIRSKRQRRRSNGNQVGPAKPPRGTGRKIPGKRR